MQKYLRFFQTKKIFILMVVLLVVIIVVFIKNSYQNIKLFVWNEDNFKFREEYESLNDEESNDGQAYPQVHLDFNKIKYINVDEVLDILNNGTGIIYIGYAECIYCRSAVQVLSDTAKNMEIESIYYLDISKIWDIKDFDDDNNVIIKVEASDSYGELLDKLGDEYVENYTLTNKLGEKVEIEDKRVKVPLVISVVNGSIVSSNVGTLFSQEDPYIPLDEDQIEGLSEIYSFQINDVLEELNN